MQDSLEPSVDYIAIFKRRWPLGLALGLFLLAAAAAVAFGLPAIYKSRAVILIEQQDIPHDLVRPLVTSYADQRIQVIAQRVLTTANLREIIEKYDLYADERHSEPMELVLEQMREDITVAPISADVVDQRSGKATKATIAFELAYDNSVPAMAQRVANDLVSLFLNENLKQRAEATEETLQFLTAELERLGKEVAAHEARLAEFKERNAGQLPELNQLNLQLMNSREQDLAQLDNQIRSLEQQRVYLESELAQQQPYSVVYGEDGVRIMAPADRLKARESQYLSLSARYGAQHPDVVAVRKEIDRLRSELGGAVADSEIEQRLSSRRAELTALKERYGAEHPDVVRVGREVAALEREAAAATRDATAVTTKPPDNPAYIQLKARLEATAVDLASLKAQRATMQRQVADFEAKLTAAPQVEREYRSLTRDYDTAIAEYKEVSAKRQEAELARSLESGQKGERFTLIEPPLVPQEPDRPNRVVISLLGVMLAMAGSFGAGAGAEMLDTRIYGRAGVLSVTGVPPLAVIPRLENTATRRKRLLKRYVLVGGVLVALLVGLLGVHFVIGPLDVLFFRLMRLLGG